MGRGTVRARWAVLAGAVAVVASCTGGEGSSTTTTAPAGTDPGTTEVSVSSTQPADGARLSLDPAVRTGTLPNGLTYYIRDNDRPGGQAELRLAIDAGSALEDDDQSAVAHFLEHMLFNGTEKYAKNEIVDILQRSGSGFGAHVNAYTSYDETVYRLTVTNSDEELDQGLDILHEWLTAVTLDPEQVASERGVVLDEFRERELSADGRVFDRIEGAYLDGTAYEGRSPIGSEDAIRGMTSEVLRRFYDDWYRPDNAAIVVVGEIDPADIEQRITAAFGDAQGRGDDPERPALSWATDGGPTAVVATDPDLTSATIDLALADAAPAEPADAAVVAAQLTDAVAMTAIADRLRSDITRGDAPFDSVEASSDDFVRAIDAPSVMMGATNADAAAAAEAMLDEFARVLQFGLTDDDVSRAVEEVRAGVDADYEQRDTTQDQDLADVLIDHHLTGAPASTPDQLHTVSSDALDALDAAAVNERIRERASAGRPILVVSAKETGAALPTETDLAAALAALADRPVEDREAVTGGAAELMTPPAPADVLNSGDIQGRPDFYIEPYGMTLENGAIVLLNPTNIAAEQVELYAFSPGGFSVTPAEDAPAVWLMNEVNSESGFGDLDAVEVERILGPSTVDVRPYPSELREIFRGSTSTSDLELALQVVHQYVVASNFDPSALQRAVDRNLEYVADPGADPDLAVELAVNEARYGDDPRFRVVLTADELRAITTEQLERVWGERFGNAGDFVFVLSGDFDLDTAKDLAARYLGTLPATDERETAVDIAPPPPRGIVAREVRAGSGDSGQLVVQYSAPATGTADERIKADVLEVVLQNRLTARVREELGASYSPDAAIRIVPDPRNEVVTQFRISGAPGDLQGIGDVLQTELADLRASGPTADETAKAIAQVKERYGLISNDTIVATLERWWYDENAIEDYANAYTDVEDVTRVELKNFAVRALPVSAYIQVTQLPR